MTEERNRLLTVINEFNQPGSSVESHGLVVQALDWRTHVVPLMGRPEEVTLQQLPVETWDIFVGMMWLRFGTPTGGVDPQTGMSFDSGTEEEFKLAYQSWQNNHRPQILFYRCMRAPKNVLAIDVDQLKRVNDFFAQFALAGEHPGFYKEFETSEEFERSVRRDLEKILLTISREKEQVAAPVPQAENLSKLAEQDEKRKRYLDSVITAHQSLPVAGFETNLRIPIPLDKVYVTLKACLAELERARREYLEPTISSAEIQQDQNVTVQEALQFTLERQYDGLVILGNPGAGKTTLAKYFLLCFATDTAEKKLGLSQRLLPLLLMLRDMDPEQSLLVNILASLQKYDLGLDEKTFLPHLEEGRALLLLDGLDEVPTESKRQQVSHWIHNKVHVKFPHCPVIVTSRFSGYRGGAVLPGHYLRLEIQDYDMPQVKQFIENWLTGVETHLHEDTPYWRNQAQMTADNLFHRIESTPALRDLAVNPLMLQIIALVHRDRGALPDRRVELYKECTDVLLERWDKAKGLEVLLSAAQARQLLQPIALWMHSVENRREVNKQEILEFMTPILPRINREVNGKELLQSWQERSGIFKGEGDIYFFHHLSFQEYLAAEEIRNTRQVKFLVKNFDQAWWREPTLLAMGLTNPPIFADFMAALLRAKWRDGGGADFMLRCLDEALVKSELPFVEALKRLRRFEARYWALLALERIGTPEAKATVKGVLEDADQRIVAQARTILARLGEVQLAEKAETMRVRIEGKMHDLPLRIFNPVELNAEYILIPGGKYKYSVTNKEVEVPSLYFAKYPITNKLYRRFIDYLAGKSAEGVMSNLRCGQFAESLLAIARKTKLGSRHSVSFAEYLGKEPTEWADKLRSRYDSNKRFNGDDQPVVGVNWFAAVAYCHWLIELHRNDPQSATANPQFVFRLPAEEEWEWAASGGKREYPWGDEKPDDTRANYYHKVGHTTPVGAYLAGTSPEGLMNMAGNVWEWMENVYGSDYAEARALRGGSWPDSPILLRCAARFPYGSNKRWISHGFRVVHGQFT